MNKSRLFMIIPIARMNSDMMDILRIIETQVDDELRQLYYVCMVPNAGRGQSAGWFIIGGHTCSDPLKPANCKFARKSRDRIIHRDWYYGSCILNRTCRISYLEKSRTQPGNTFVFD